MRKLSAILAVLLLAVPATQAGQEPLAGNWKITFYDRGDLITFWLLKVESKDGKVNGTLVTVDKGPMATLQDLTAKDGKLKFVLNYEKQPISFVINTPKGETKKLRGLMSFQNMTFPVQLEATKQDNLKDVNPFNQTPSPKGTYKE